MGISSFPERGIVSIVLYETIRMIAPNSWIADDAGRRESGISLVAISLTLSVSRPRRASGNLLGARTEIQAKLPLCNTPPTKKSY